MTRKCVINDSNNGCIGVPGPVQVGILANYHGLLGHLSGMKPLLLLLVTPVLMLLPHNMFAGKRPIT